MPFLRLSSCVNISAISSGVKVCIFSAIRYFRLCEIAHQFSPWIKYLTFNYAISQFPSGSESLECTLTSFKKPLGSLVVNPIVKRFDSKVLFEFSYLGRAIFKTSDNGFKNKFFNKDILHSFANFIKWIIPIFSLATIDLLIKIAVCQHFPDLSIKFPDISQLGNLPETISHIPVVSISNPQRYGAVYPTSGTDHYANPQ